MAKYSLNYDYCPHCKGDFSFSKPLAYDNCGGRGECPFCGYDIPNCWTYIKNIKPKPKLKRVKAWAWKSESGKWLATEWNSIDRIPCTILIDAKYLKGKEQNK